MNIISQDMSRLIKIKSAEQVEVREILGGGAHIMIRDESGEYVDMGVFLEYESAERCHSELIKMFEANKAIFIISPDDGGAP